MFTLTKNDTSENSNNMFKYFQAIVLLAFVLALVHHECVGF
jgi:succinate dehydrogenase/fumarate reductase cytochrome b subunit